MVWKWYNVRVKGMPLEEYFLDYTIKKLDWK